MWIEALFLKLRLFVDKILFTFGISIILLFSQRHILRAGAQRDSMLVKNADQRLENLLRISIKVENVTHDVSQRFVGEFLQQIFDLNDVSQLLNVEYLPVDVSPR